MKIGFIVAIICVLAFGCERTVSDGLHTRLTLFKPNAHLLNGPFRDSLTRVLGVDVPIFQYVKGDTIIRFELDVEASNILYEAWSFPFPETITIDDFLKNKPLYIQTEIDSYGRFCVMNSEHLLFRCSLIKQPRELNIVYSYPLKDYNGKLYPIMDLSSSTNPLKDN